MTKSTNENNGLTLIVGGAGKTGRRIVEKLTAQNHPLRIVSRSSEIRFDWNDPSTWDAALEGATAAYVMYWPDLAVPEAPAAIERFARLADKHDVKRLVLLSGRGEEAAQRCEQIVQSVRPEWTVVRASWFNQNFNESFFLDPLLQGVLALPAGGIPEPFVDAEDIADVAVAALTEDGHEGRIYEVTGPRLLTFADIAAEVSNATGRNIEYREISAEDFVTGLRAQGLPESLVSLMDYLFTQVLDGRNAYVADGVERALGRPARDFSDFAREAAASGVWNAAHSNTDDAPSNEHTMRAFIDEFVNGGDESALERTVHTDYVYRTPTEELRGHDGLSALFKSYRSAFPDLKVTIDDLVDGGDTIVVSVTLTGTHRGDLLGIPASDAPVKVHGMIRSRFRDGLITEEWEILDQLSLFEQIGAVGSTS